MPGTAGRVGAQPAADDGGEAGDLTREWRRRMDTQQEKAASALEATAITLERLTNRLDEHDKRISNLERRPAGFRSDVGTYGGCLGMLLTGLISSAIGGTALTVSVLELILRLSGH